MRGGIPQKNFIGVERLLGRIQKLDRKGRRAGLTNLRGVRIESAYFLQYLLPPHSAAALHIYFPDPWPKKKHRRHRLINGGFPRARPRRARARRRGLFADGRRGLFPADDGSFRRERRNFKKLKRRRNWRNCLTDFERDFNARGIPTLRAAYQSKNNGD